MDVDLERVNGIEPSSPAWEAGVITVIRHPHRARTFDLQILAEDGQ